MKIMDQRDGIQTGDKMLNQRQVKGLFRKLQEVELKLERSNLYEFMKLVQNPVRLIFLNFLSGLARGFGIAVGLTIVASLFIMLLTRLARLNLPVIGEFVADLVRIVNDSLRRFS